jgi:hypothetical protein
MNARSIRPRGTSRDSLVGTTGRRGSLCSHWLRFRISEEVRTDSIGRSWKKVTARLSPAMPHSAGSIPSLGSQTRRRLAGGMAMRGRALDYSRARGFRSAQGRDSRTGARGSHLTTPLRVFFRSGSSFERAVRVQTSGLANWLLRECIRPESTKMGRQTSGLPVSDQMAP